MRVADGYLVYAVHTLSLGVSVAPITLSVSISLSLPCCRSLNVCFVGPVATQGARHTHTHYTAYVYALQRDW
ncbi:uncharacterized protein BDZ83DRAFT_617217 [Colletotrichum acutatum]|uniref:Uncharacterized protein n=1 Tax=Glomerella acutata TaxID=27357 RepID=A0AAD8UMI8_GLOAC|nr:uncharacterized protein BDZ83DRAFT_617217 [Colletotrichum acutatum]KAK1726123.1 hypothetical protein BDZ83DRAFT_617217 [Colletotrichum acutatum]